MVPRTRACRFSTERPVSATDPSHAWTIGVIGISDQCSPCRFARSSASVRECALDHSLGRLTTWTASGPSASQASVATSAESMPPDSPSTTDVKPFLRTYPRIAVTSAPHTSASSPSGSAIPGTTGS